MKVVKCCIALLFWFSIQSVFAQVNIDSIFDHALSLGSKDATFDYLGDISVVLTDNSTPDCEDYFEKYILYAKKEVGTFAEIYATTRFSDYLTLMGKPEFADSILNLYLPLDETWELRTKVQLLSGLGASHSQRLDCEAAATYFEQAIQLMEDANEWIPAPAFYRNYGKCLTSLGRFSESAKWLNVSKEQALQLQDSFEVDQTLVDLSILFSQIGLYDQAAAYVLERQNYIYPPWPLSNAIDHVNISRNLILQQRYTEAIDGYKLAINLGPFDAQFKMLPMYAYNGIVEAHYFLGNYDSVAHYFNRLDNFFDELDRNETYNYLYKQSRWLYRLSTKQFSLAEQDGVDLYQGALEKKDDAEIQMYTKFFAETYRLSGEYEKAFSYEKSYSRMRDSIQTSNKTQALLLFQTQYETAEKENTILNLQAEKTAQEATVKQNRLRYIAAFISLFLVGGFFVMRQFYNNKIKRAVEIERLRTKISSDLHDDVGSLLTGLSMQTEILEDFADESMKPNLSRISEMSRSAMSKMRDAVWAMDSRQDKWQNIVDRMHEFAHETLVPKNINYTIDKSKIDMSNKVMADVRQTIYLIFKEAVTNIIKHSDASLVQISLSEQLRNIKMEISDNGKVESNKISGGQGLSNMKMRAERVGGKFDLKTKDGYHVSVTI